MKCSILFFISILISCSAYSQNMDELQVDKLKRELVLAKNDTTKALVLTQLAEVYRDRVTDTSFTYAQNALELSRRINYPMGESKALLSLSYYFFNRGNLTQSLELGLKALEIAKKNKLTYDQAFAMIRVGNVYMNLKDYHQALNYYHQTRELTKNSTDSFFYAVTFWRAAAAYDHLNLTDSALLFAKQAEDTAKKMGNKFILGGIAPILGNIYAKKGNDQLALEYYRKSPGTSSFINMAAFFKNNGVIDSAIYYAERAYQSSIKNSIRHLELSSSLLLATLYESKEPQKSIYFLKNAMNARDSLYGAEQVAAVTSIAFKDKERENEIMLAQMNYRNNVKLYSTLAGLTLLLIVALLLFKNIKNERKANKLLTEQKNEIVKTLSELKATQAQLIQSEKMASLGELTAGIAHEIQNPLNFVNNFSEVNTELVEELKYELASNNMQQAIVIADDIKENEQKISHHGKRADAIVKGMLQHSRSNSGQKEPTDINALTDEYLRLAYHGLRAKDNSFNATLKTNYDDKIEKNNVVPQDIGRVILNLITNAFYSVNEKSLKAKFSGDSAYEPTVTVSTKKTADTVEISVKDNGGGIPQKVLDKIFQPFFTTKPTGEGTGLGLSLSYDIVKAHGGELKVETKEGEGSKFIVELQAYS
jgi:two-component system, NtrC family, sensor kinase